MPADSAVLCVDSIQMTRPFLPMFQFGFGGIGAVDRVPNNPAAISQWKNATRANIGTSINVECNNPTCYLVGDVNPISNGTTGYLGYDLTSSDYLRVAISELQSVSTADVVAAASQYVSITTVFSYSEQTPGTLLCVNPITLGCFLSGRRDSVVIWLASRGGKQATWSQASSCSPPYSTTTRRLTCS